MAQEQINFAFDATLSVAPAVGSDLRDEIAAAWGLPLGEKVEVFFRDGSLDAIAGTLELASAPNYPWNPREPLQLRIAGFTFNNRDIEHWLRT